MKKRLDIKLLKNNSGITLITLVITIIVLIILAGVSIKIILGDNGLVEKTKYAKEQQTIETIREKLDIVKGSDYIEQKGNNSIDTYFETLEKEKIKPYIVTNKQKMTDVIGNIEVDNKYSYIVKIENDKNLKIEYEGKVGEVTREPDEVTITITGEKEQANLPITLNANIKINGEDAQSGRYVINTTADELGIEDAVYTEQITDSNIDVTLEQANNYYIHTLTIDKYGRKQEIIKGPIQITTKCHKHIGDATNGGGCYATPVYKVHTHISSCYSTQTVQSTCQCGAYDGRYLSNGAFVCMTCGHSGHGPGGICGASISSTQTIIVCGKTQGQRYESEGIEIYSLNCGKTETTIEGYIVNY